MPNIKNELGSIFVDNEVIARIAGTAAMECYGIVGMAIKNVKDGIVQLLRKENLAKGIKLYSEGEMLSIDLHIIVEIGTNIPAITETLVNTVKYRLEESLGFNVDRINVYVEGIRTEE